jgi:propionaldehyde dehydrogenase
MTLLNKAIVEAGGPTNLMTAVAEPSLRTAKIIMEHPNIDMVVATGGGSVVRAALSSGKTAIAAGPGNPVVIVDRTADIPHTAQCIVEGASFDNNLLCIGEKSVLVADSVADELIQNMCQCGAQLVNSGELQQITKLIVENGGQSRDWIGKYASEILQGAGLNASSDTKIIIAETNADHVLVTEEFLMPIIPIVRVNDFDEAVGLAVKIEGGNHHTGIIHSRCTDNITEFGKAINTTVFVVNGPSLACEGGDGILAMTVATGTGQGFTRPIHFTRQRRLTFAGGMSIYSL